MGMEAAMEMVISRMPLVFALAQVLINHQEDSLALERIFPC